MTRRARRPPAVLLAGLLLSLLLGCSEPAAPGSALPAPSGSPAAPVSYARVPVVTTSGFDVGDGLEAWREYAPVQDVRIPSTSDGAQQPAYWLPPARPGEGLLVYLHSWSTSYERGLGAPYAQWAAGRGWGLVAPDFRGPNERPEATGSPLAVQDVLDAVDWAVREGEVDPERVYLVGLSGGGMMSLLAGATAPERFAGVVAWAPVVDIGRFYAFSERIGSERGYQQDIEASCGGDPTRDPQAAQECRSRSPEPRLAALREAGTPVYLGVGDRDEILPSSESVRAFNALADPADRLGEDYQAALYRAEPPAAESDRDLSGFSDEEPELFLTRTSGTAMLSVFSGLHEMLYNPTLVWISRLDQR